jgi:hypothetical protein
MLGNKIYLRYTNKCNYNTRFCKHNPTDNEANNHKYNATAVLPIRTCIIECYYHLFHDNKIDADLFGTISFHFEQQLHYHISGVALVI